MQIWRWNLKNKQFLRPEINDICETFEQHPFFIREAEFKTIKVTSLTKIFVDHFGRKNNIQDGYFNVGEYIFRILFFKSGSVINKCRLYTDVINDYIVENEPIDFMNLDPLSKMIYHYWNPGGIYAIQGWLFERT